MKQTTIKDIAKALNINPSTVSRGLKKHPDISEAMQKRIFEVSKLMNYRPNQMAVNFRQSHSKLIALILPDISTYFFPAVIKAVMSEAQRKGYNILMLQSGENQEREQENLEICRMMNVEGVIVSVTKHTTTDFHFQELEQNEIPVVFLDKTPTALVNFSVTFDDALAAQTAVEHLIRCEAKKILGVLGNENLSITQKRQTGMEKAIAESNAKAKIAGWVYANNTEEAYRKVKLHSKTKYDALFCMSDEVLTGTMRALHERVVLIPEEVQVVAISDGIMPYFFNPTITFVESSGYNMGQTACLELMRLIEDKTIAAPRHIIQNTPLIINRSTKSL